MDNQTPITIADLYPEFTKEERDAAEGNLRRYLAVLLGMAEQMQATGGSINDLVDCRLADSGDQL